MRRWRSIFETEILGPCFGDFAPGALSFLGGARKSPSLRCALNNLGSRRSYAFPVALLPGLPLQKTIGREERRSYAFPVALLPGQSVPDRDRAEQLQLCLPGGFVTWTAGISLPGSRENCSYAFPVALLPGRGRTTHGPPGAGAAMHSRWLCSFDSPAAARGHCRPSGRLRRGSLIGWVSVKAHDDS